MKVSICQDNEFYEELQWFFVDTPRCDPLSIIAWQEAEHKLKVRLYQHAPHPKCQATYRDWWHASWHCSLACYRRWARDESRTIAARLSLGDPYAFLTIRFANDPTWEDIATYRAAFRGLRLTFVGCSQLGQEWQFHEHIIILTNDKDIANRVRGAFPLNVNIHPGWKQNPVGAAKYLVGDTKHHRRAGLKLFEPHEGFRPLWQSRDFYGGDKGRYAAIGRGEAVAYKDYSTHFNN